MKKIIIAAISAIAVIVSVTSCQIYDSQTNKNLYHNGQKLQDFVADFNEACETLKDNSTDEEAYNRIMDSFIGFTEFFWEKTAMASVKYVVNNERATEMNAWVKQYKKDTGKSVKKSDAVYKEKQAELVERDNKNLHDVDWCCDKYKSSCISQSDLYVAINAYGADSYESLEYDWNGGLDGGSWSLAAIWEKTYKLKWDYNSKK